ncbi:PAS domain S-box protein [Roseivirga misakiensis]|uniref:PAS domain S-box protein n=1 Tax=Roseivirga misakiensis TaxID=1563681 RepID=UPI000B0207B4|nr:PAS domain S-box protein [Roseivirga misakiensis]
MELVVGQKVSPLILKAIIPQVQNSSISSFTTEYENIILSAKVDASTDLYHITFSKREDRELQKKYATDKYRLLVEAAQDVIYEIDLNGQFTYVNPKATEVSGYSEAECLKMSYLELVRDDWEDRVQAFYLKQVKESIHSTYLEFPIITKKGKEVWLGQNVQLLEDEIAQVGLMAIARDITIVHDTQKALERSEEKYRGIIQNLQYGLMEVDLDEKIIYANEAMCLITGYSQEELVGQHASDLLVDETTRSVIDNQHEQRLEGVASVYQLKLRHKNGDELWALISGAPIFDVDGNRVGSIGIHMDITEKQRDQEALVFARNQLEQQNEKLHKNQKFLSAINGFVTKLLNDETLFEIAWEIAENVIDQFGFEDCVIYVLNDDTGKLTQLAAYGAKSTKNRQVVDPIEIEMGVGIVGTVAQSGVAEIIKDTTKDPRYIVDDAKRQSEITVPIIADGKVIGIIDSEHSDKNYFSDAHLEILTTVANLASNRLKNAIANQKQLQIEGELRDSEEKLRTILESAIDGVISIDAKGVIAEWNKQAEVIFGYKAEEVIGLTLTETIIPPNFREAHDRGMKHYFRTGEGPVLNQKIEISALRKNGEEFPIELAIIPVRTKGVQTFTAFLSDITIQKEVRLEMEKALNKEKEVNELKSRFVAMTSHEFRTPLTTIKQNSDLISHRLELTAPDQFPKYAKYFDRIESELGRVTGLMNDILMLGRIESGKIEIKKKENDLVEFCQQLVDKQRVDENPVMNFKIQGVPRPIMFDRQLLHHVVLNLLTNATKYSTGKKDPQVTLVFNELDKARIHVKDFGIGIPKKDQKGLFQSFYRATNVKNIQGSGLGLSIVKEFTEMHGGKVEVISEVNKGAEFIVEIPDK